MFIDTHTHLNFKVFKDDFDAVYKASLDANVGVMVNVGSNYQTSLEAVRKIHKGDLYASIGVHPIHLAEDITEICMINGKEYKVVTKKEVFDYEKYLELAKNDGVVAIGETGLDYFHVNENNKSEIRSTKSETNSKLKIQNIKQIQKDVFKKHIKLANEFDLPMILHCRGSEEEPDGAYDEMIEILKVQSEKLKVQSNNEKLKNEMSSRANNVNVAISDEIASCLAGRQASQATRNDNKMQGVMHCFVGTLEQAKKFIDMGFMIGVNGIVTFKNSTRLQDIVRELPLSKIVLETDCPFLAPEPYRGKRNEPKYIPIIAKKIAELKNIKLKEVEEQTTKNAKELFNL